jgi:iron complex outermembrane recepter protein
MVSNYNLTNMRHLLFVIVCFFISGIMAMAGETEPVKVSMTGKVVDAKTGEALPGASIYISDDKIGTIADGEGKYVLTNIPIGHHVVEISHLGYNTIVEHIEINNNIEKNFSLSPVVLENREVIVTGVSGPTNMRKAPVPVTVVKKTALLQSAATNIIDALSHVPGVSQLSSGPSVSKPVIRGLSSNRIVTVNDGVRQEGQQWGDEHGIEIDELSVNKVEVLKGPSSLIYGSDAMGGVVNFITNVPVAQGVTKGSILTNYQTNNGLLAINGNAAGNKNGFNWNIYGTLKSAGNYRNKYDGLVLNSAYNEKNAGGYIGINKSWGYSHFIFSRFDQRLGMVEGERDDATGNFILFGGTAQERIVTTTDLESRKLFVPMQRVQHNKLVSDNNFAIKKSRLKINLALQKNTRQEFGNPDDPAEKELQFNLSTFNYSMQWQIPELKEWHTTIGVNGMAQQNKNAGEEVLIPQYRSFDIGGFLFAQRFFKKATLSGGFRFDNRNISGDSFTEGAVLKFTDFKKSYANFTGSIGISYEPADNITLKGNIARGFRSPTVAELASNGTHEGTNRYEYGSLSLKAEASWQGDAGIDYNNEHFSIGLSAFYNSISNFIFYSKLQSITGSDSLVNVGGEFIPAFKFDQHSAKLAGIEFSFDLHPHPLDWLHIENSFALVRGKFDNAIDGSVNLPLMPAPRWISELSGQFKKAGKSLAQVYTKLTMDYTFSQHNFFSGYDTETSTKGYALLNLGMGGDVLNKKRKTAFSIHLAVINITNTAWQSHLSRLKYTATNLVTGRGGVFNAGRNLSIKVNVPLVFGDKK